MGKIGKTLGNLLRTGVFCLASALIPACTGCEKENYPPTSYMENSALSGEIPLSNNVKITGTDPDGPNDIHWYELYMNDKKIKESPTPIDTTLIFSEPGVYRIYGRVIDSKNHISQTKTERVEAYGKHFIDQSASLSNDIEIKYDATLYRVNEANLKVEKNGEEFLTQKITDVNETGKDFEKTYNYTADGITKGNYEFILTSGDLEKTTSVEVPNYTPTATSIAPLNFVEEADTTITLPKPTDKNLEDIANISWTEATSLDNKTTPTLIYEGETTKLKLKGNRNQTGAYQVKLKFGSVSGGLEEKILTGNIAEDTRTKIYMLNVPHPEDLNCYGSGDVNRDYEEANIINQNDIVRLEKIINGTFSDASDTRLNARADVNGDNSVDIFDKNLLQDYLNGVRDYLPWNLDKLPTRAEKEDWLTKMINIYLLNNYNFPSCAQYSDQALINFNGFNSETDSLRFLEIYPYDFSQKRYINWPVYKIVIVEFDDNGKPTGTHAMNTIAFDNVLYWNNLCNIEFQLGGHINVQPGELYFNGTNSEVYICGPPTNPKVGANVTLTEYIKYTIKNNIPSEGIPLQESNPYLKIIYEN